jgi:hypothetical protein
MNLIVPAELCEPPSEGLMFRHLLMVSKLDLLYSNLVFCQEDMVDLYYHYMKERFIFDFVDDIVTQQEDGYFLSIKFVRAENVNNVIENLRLI